jgi:alpha,alpha-trehalase
MDVKAEAESCIGIVTISAQENGIPPEVEPGHFDWFLQKYADKYGLTIRELEIAYNGGRIVDSEMDDFFLHDAAVRESGHDTS